MASPGRGWQASSILSSVFPILTDPATKSATVIRGYQDSTAVAHITGDETLVNPRFQPVAVFEAMVDEINSWGPQLFKVIGVQATVAEGDETYQLGTTISGCYGIIELLRQWDHAIDGDGLSINTAWPRLPYRLQRATTAWTAGPATTGVQVRFLEHVYAGKIMITAAVPFDASAMTTTQDLVTDVGLQPSMLDVLTKGTHIRLQMDDEHGRSSRHAQDEPRLAQELPWNGGSNALQLAIGMYQQRKTQEAMKLLAKYPMQSLG